MSGFRIHSSVIQFEVVIRIVSTLPLFFLQIARGSGSCAW